MRSVLRPNTALFALASTAIVAFAIAFFRSATYAAHPDVVAWGLTFDLTLTIPMAYWLLFVRSGRARAITVAPVFVLCAAVASRIVPADQQHFLHQLGWIGAPLDVLSIWLVARRLAHGSGIGSGVIERIVVSEVTMLRYSIFGWRKKAPAGFTVHNESGWGAVLAILLFAIAGESFGVHIVIQHWSVRAAWIVTAIDFYGVLWLLGDYHALRLHPTTIEDGVLRVRYGFRWSADVPLTDIAAFEPVRGEWKRKGILKMAMFDEPLFLITLRGPVAAAAFGGLITRSIDAIAIRPDEPERFESELGRAMSATR